MITFQARASDLTWWQGACQIYACASDLYKDYRAGFAVESGIGSEEMHGLIAARIEAQACALQDACKIVETFLSFNMAVRMPTLLISGHSPMRLQPAEEHAVTALTGQVLQLLQQCSKLRQRSLHRCGACAEAFTLLSTLTFTLGMHLSSSRRGRGRKGAMNPRKLDAICQISRLKISNMVSFLGALMLLSIEHYYFLSIIVKNNILPNGLGILASFCIQNNLGKPAIQQLCQTPVDGLSLLPD